MDVLFLSQTALFRGCSPRETADMLQCLRAERRVYYFVIEWELFINVFRRFLERA